MTGQSALLGDQPATPDDKLVAAAIKALASSEFFPNTSEPYGPPRPSTDPPDPWSAGNIVDLYFFFIFLLFFLIVGRILIRWKNSKFGLDDIFVIPSARSINRASTQNLNTHEESTHHAATAIVCNALVIYISYAECYGHHICCCRYKNLANLYEALSVNQTIFWIALHFAKISLIFLNRRLMIVVRGAWIIVQWLVLGIVVVCFLLSLFTTIFQCTPVTSHYNLYALGSTVLKDPKSLHCLDSTELELAFRWLHVATDLILLAIPLVLLYTLPIFMSKKVGMGFFFCFGIVCCVASIAHNYHWTHPFMDFTYDSSVLVIWDLIDVNFAPIVACLPVYYDVMNSGYVQIRSRLPGGLSSQKKIRGDRNSHDCQDSISRLEENGFAQELPSYSEASDGLEGDARWPSDVTRLHTSAKDEKWERF